MMGSHHDIAEDLNEYRVRTESLHVYSSTTKLNTNLVANSRKSGRILEHWYGYECQDGGKFLKVLQSFPSWWKSGTPYWRGQSLASYTCTQVL